MSDNGFELYSDGELLVGLCFGELDLRKNEYNNPDLSLYYELEYQAFCWVVFNRVNNKKRWGKTIRDVIFQPQQFSCFNLGNPRRKKILEFLKDYRNPLYRFIVKQVKRSITDYAFNLQDRSRGANHYVANWFYDKAPDSHWCKHLKVTNKHKTHIFLKE